MAWAVIHRPLGGKIDYRLRSVVAVPSLSSRPNGGW